MEDCLASLAKSVFLPATDNRKRLPLKNGLERLVERSKHERKRNGKERFHRRGTNKTKRASQEKRSQRT